MTLLDGLAEALAATFRRSAPGLERLQPQVSGARFLRVVRDFSEEPAAGRAQISPSIMGGFDVEVTSDPNCLDATPSNFAEPICDPALPGASEWQADLYWRLAQLRSAALINGVAAIVLLHVLRSGVAVSCEGRRLVGVGLRHGHFFAGDDAGQAARQVEEAAAGGGCGDSAARLGELAALAAEEDALVVVALGKKKVHLVPFYFSLGMPCRWVVLHLEGAGSEENPLPSAIDADFACAGVGIHEYGGRDHCHPLHLFAAGDDPRYIERASVHATRHRGTPKPVAGDLIGSGASVPGSDALCGFAVQGAAGVPDAADRAHTALARLLPGLPAAPATAAPASASLPPDAAAADYAGRQLAGRRLLAAAHAVAPGNEAWEGLGAKVRAREVVDADLDKVWLAAAAVVTHNKLAQAGLGGGAGSSRGVVPEITQGGGCEMPPVPGSLDEMD
mmetsp:Transcript_26248/g.59390  ORF Transcript_26248/g.59390 Transcript_26248/m.59390 type:complete len:448 (+) Transcript_26248:568-1911(+)